MSPQIVDIAWSLIFAWGAGSLIGFERSYHGRAAGFRTHALVALASAAAMVIAKQPVLLPGPFATGPGRLDPTHIAQGVMTGVGFLGAGVIFKEGVSVQGLTTAACIWGTAAVGLLFGLDLYAMGVLTTAAMLVTLIAFRWLEDALPGQVYAHAVLRFRAEKAPTEAGLHALLDEHKVIFQDLSYRVLQGGEMHEFSGMLITRRREAFPDLAERLKRAPDLLEFELSRVSK